MSDRLTTKVNKFDFADNKKEVHLNCEVSGTTPGAGDINFLFVQVGAEDPIMVPGTGGTGRQSGAVDTVVNIEKTVKMISGGRGNKPVVLVAHMCWVYNEAQGRAWIAANAAITNPMKSIYL